MAGNAQHKGKLYMDTSSSATVASDVSSGVTEFAFKVDQNTGEYFVLSGNWAQATVGGKKWSLDISAIVETGTTNAYHYLMDWLLTGSTSRTFEGYSPDASTGSIKLSGECVAKGASPALEVKAGEGKAQISKFSLMGDGTLAKAAVA